MKPLIRLLVVAVFFSILTSPALADRKSREEEKARQQRLERQLRDLEYILKHESDGTLSDRKDALKAMLSTGIAPDEAYWQAGYIKKGDKWVSVQDRWLTPEQEQQVDEYAKVRNEFADRDEDHYKLARWCAQNGFDAQAYAHLKAVLLNHPDHAGLRRLLGYQKIGNQWMNQEEYDAAVREADRLVQQLQEWGPKVAEIRKKLRSVDPRQQERAKAQLKEIREVAAIPALELILLPSSDVAATLCVEQLCEIEHRLSSVALCEAILNLPESAGYAKQVALEELKMRPLDDFVPVLLGKMQTMLTLQWQLFSRSWSERSQLPFLRAGAYRRLREVDWAEVKVSNESQYEVRNHLLSCILRNQTVHEVTLGRADSSNPHLRNRVEQFARENFPPQEFTPSSGQRFRGVEERESNLRNHHDQLFLIEKAVRFQNEEIDNRNEEISFLLGSVSDQEIDREPEYWWSWWNQQTGMELPVKANREIREVIEVAEAEEFMEVIIMKSCFVAGTPVWTDLGPRPIEELSVGDMALTKDAETGELAYRPILRTTVRKRKPNHERTLVTIDLGAEQITSTGGHPFFVSGEGWVRARELKAGHFLHTPTGTIQIDSVTETPDEETYNLVIDGFHTYFVGMSQALVHDVSITSPTDAVVPGLLDR